MNIQHPHNYVITIGRQFGSGGRVIGRALAEALHIEFYDKSLLQEAARHAGICCEHFERNDEKAPSFFNNVMSLNMGYSAYGIYPGAMSINDDTLHRVQSEVITAIADRGPCVIVGRSADYVLRQRNNVISIFIHAPLEYRVKAIMERGDAATEREARQLAEKSDKLRANYYNFYTDKKWGEAAGYDLSIDSSRLSTEDIITLITNYINLRQ